MRLSEYDRELMVALAQELNLSQRAVLSLSIRQMAQREGIMKEHPHESTPETPTKRRTSRSR